MKKKLSCNSKHHTPTIFFLFFSYLTKISITHFLSVLHSGLYLYLLHPHYHIFHQQTSLFRLTFLPPSFSCSSSTFIPPSTSLFLHQHFFLSLLFFIFIPCSISPLHLSPNILLPFTYSCIFLPSFLPSLPLPYSSPFLTTLHP